AHLSEEKLAEWGRHMGTGLPGHEKMDWDYVLGRKPDYVIIYGNILDGVGSYERIELPWTEDTDLRRFLSVYRRRE
ncbi:MAG TPA: hypothetical protein VER55_05885, partial [Ardenticatenaceae bacterium]|nr:hypothetical protein [Ardenticatenaceae bacterium]